LIVSLRIAGIGLIALTLAHVAIAKRFQWKEESERLSPFNRQAMLVHAFFIALTVGFMGALALFWAPALIIPSALGLPVTIGLTLFWGIRLYCQWLVYEWDLWLGKRFETSVHLLFSVFWLYLTVVFGCCMWLQLKEIL